MICIEKETQKIVNLLHDYDNESSKFAPRKWYIINDENNGQYRRGNENHKPLNLREKLLNQIFVITQMDIFL